MNTTIQVDVETKLMLERVKKTYRTRSYDEAIRKLVKKKAPSLYGSLVRGKKVSGGEVLRTLRDEDERI